MCNLLTKKLKAVTDSLGSRLTTDRLWASPWINCATWSWAKQVSLLSVYPLVSNPMMHQNFSIKEFSALPVSVKFVPACANATHCVVTQEHMW